MSDEELNLEDVAGGDEAVDAGGGGKPGFLSGMVITILKWAAIAIGFIILGVTTTLITFKMVNKGRQVGPVVSASEKYSTTEPILEYYEGLGTVRGVTSDQNPAIFSGRFLLGYTMGDKELNAELINRKDELRNLVLKYLSSKTFDQLRANKYAQIEEDLKVAINRRLSTGRIKKVLVDDFTVIR